MKDIEPLVFLAKQTKGVESELGLRAEYTFLWILKIEMHYKINVNGYQGQKNIRNS